jgi:thiol:disulfide interchange protein
MGSSQHPAFLVRHKGKLLLGLLLVLGVVLWWPFIDNAVRTVIGAPPPEDRIAWRTDYDAALLEAQQANRPLLVYFTADWCPPCQVMKRNTWPDRMVGELAEKHYIAVKIDVDLPTSDLVARRYAVMAVPTILITDPQGHALTAGGFQSTRELRTFLRNGARVMDETVR